MREVTVKGGYVALVDDEDYELVSGHRWTYHKPNKSLTVYARTGSMGGPFTCTA